jgi:hypothetical protein
VAIQVDEEGRQLAPCGKCLIPPHGFGCVCPTAPRQKAHKGADSVEALKDRPPVEPPPPKPAPPRKPGICTPPPRPESNVLPVSVVNLEALNEKMGEAVELLKIIAGGMVDRAKGIGP